VNCECKEPVYSCADCAYNLCGECNTRAVQREAAERQREQEREAAARQQMQEEEAAQRFQEKVARFQEKRAAKVIEKQVGVWLRKLAGRLGPIRFKDRNGVWKENDNRKWHLSKERNRRFGSKNPRIPESQKVQEFRENRAKNLEYRKKRFQATDAGGRPKMRSKAVEFVSEVQPSGRIVDKTKQLS